MKHVLLQPRKKRRPNACFKVIDTASGKPSSFYDAVGAYLAMGEEARSDQRDFARRTIKLKEGF